LAPPKSSAADQGCALYTWLSGPQAPKRII